MAKLAPSTRTAALALPWCECLSTGYFDDDYDDIEFSLGIMQCDVCDDEPLCDICRLIRTPPQIHPDDCETTCVVASVDPSANMFSLSSLWWERLTEDDYNDDGPVTISSGFMTCDACDDEPICDICHIAPKPGWAAWGMEAAAQWGGIPLHLRVTTPCVINDIV